MTHLHQQSPPDAKIRLFRELFRGREDVFARRFESRKTGRAGYAQACGNEWVRGVCEKPRIQCAVCRNRAFLPVDDTAVRAHLTGTESLQWGGICRADIQSTKVTTNL